MIYRTPFDKLKETDSRLAYAMLDFAYNEGYGQSVIFPSFHLMSEKELMDYYEKFKEVLDEKKSKIRIGCIPY